MWVKNVIAKSQNMIDVFIFLIIYDNLPNIPLSFPRVNLHTRVALSQKYSQSTVFMLLPVLMVLRSLNGIEERGC